MREIRLNVSPAPNQIPFAVLPRIARRHEMRFLWIKATAFTGNDSAYAQCPIVHHLKKSEAAPILESECSTLGGACGYSLRMMMLWLPNSFNGDERILCVIPGCCV